MNQAAAGGTALLQTDKKPKSRPELGALTGVRFFAAIYVVFYHFVSPNLHTSVAPLGNILSAGYSAVGFFFLLSGFVLTYSYVNTGKVIDRARFWKARFSRIYPAYLFAFLLAAPFQIWGSIHVNGLRVAAEKLTLGAALVLTLLQSWTPWTAWYWNIPAWSLSVEVFFYLCFPFLALLVAGMRPRTCLKIAAITWLAGVLVPALYCAYRPVMPQPPFSMLQLAIETNPILRLPEFFAGMLLGRLFTSGFRFSNRLAAVLAVGALAGLVGMLAFSPAIPRPLLSNSVLTPLSALLIFALAHQTGWLAHVFSNRPLRVLGEASYAIYILQFPVSYLLHLNNETFTYFRFVAFLAALIVLSVLTFFFIEQPLRLRMLARPSRMLANEPVTCALRVTPESAVKPVLS
jgi:peptidoglycan/LPS O-acetylase OafA/YrhL